ncbi:hypothetical protein HGRIS_006908 [Hohenbuehelia grisea]|uniref:Uncharacterized protein n=1 Tax=Hohenbuehelia grisea TaxID=104357 RepID=A0ABR3JAZ4_9AGAR
MSESSRQLDSFHPRKYYILLSITPATPDPLSIRKIIQDSLNQVSGATVSSTYVDLLWYSKDGAQAVFRVDKCDAPKIMASVVTTGTSPRLSILKDSDFLPSVLSMVTS